MRRRVPILCAKHLRFSSRPRQARAPEVALPGPAAAPSIRASDDRFRRRAALPPHRPRTPGLAGRPLGAACRPRLSADLLDAARLPRDKLETLEDRLVDRLVWRATAAGATAFVARAPRAEIDLNRDEREIDPAMVAPPLPPRSLLQSARTRGGLGLIPSRITGAGAIWRERICARRAGAPDRRDPPPLSPGARHGAGGGARAASAPRSCSIAIRCRRAAPAAPAPPTSCSATATAPRIAAELLDAAVERGAGARLPQRPQRALCRRLFVARHGRPARRHPRAPDRDRPLALSRRRAARARARLRPDARRLIAAVAAALAKRLLEPAQAIAAE